jgi:Tol biopolymer transport system component
VIYNLDNGRMRETPIAGGFSTEQYATMRYELPMAWSPDGNQLVTTVYDKGSEYLAWYDMSKGSAKFVTFRPGLSQIYQIAWSPDGTQLVCSGLHNGQVDLYRFIPGNGSFVQLTNDLQDDLYPVWNAEGTVIYHASSRLSPKSGLEKPRFDCNDNTLNVWAYDVASSSLSQVTHSKMMNEYPVGMLSSFELLVRSDQSGILNLQKINVFLGDSTYQTNTPIGMYRAAISDSLLAYASTAVGELQVRVAPRAQALHEQVTVRNILRQYNDKAASMALQKKDAAFKLDSIRRAALNTVVKLDTTDTQGTPGDSAKTEDRPVKYYVFDDDEEKTQPKRRVKKSNADFLLKKEPEKPDFDAIELGSASRTRTTWVADRITTRFSFDPIFKLSLLGEARLRDQQGHQQLTLGFRPYVDFRSSDTYMRYTNMKHALDWQVGFTRSGRFLNKYDLSARYNSTRIDGLVSLPLNRYLSVSAGGNLALLERKNLELLVPKNIDGHAFMVGSRLNLTYDKTENNGNFVTKGTFATVDAINAYSLNVKTDHFITAKFDLREYLPFKKCVLATRITGAWSQGPMQQQFYLGGTPEALLSKWNNPVNFPIESPNLPTLHYMEYVTPIRGFQFNGRNGSKYAAANAELRIPVSRIFMKYLNTNPAYNFELIPFFDIGSTWTQGNPLSQKNPIDTETITSYPLTITVQTLKSPFLMGFGAGTRMQMFGYSMRFDLAWGLDDYTLLNPRLHMSLAKNF